MTAQKGRQSLLDSVSLFARYIPADTIISADAIYPCRCDISRRCDISLQVRDTRQVRHTGRRLPCLYGRPTFRCVLRGTCAAGTVPFAGERAVDRACCVLPRAPNACMICIKSRKIIKNRVNYETKIFRRFRN